MGQFYEAGSGNGVWPTNAEERKRLDGSWDGEKGARYAEEMRMMLTSSYQLCT